MKYAIVFACTVALVSALRVPSPRAADTNNQVDKRRALRQGGDETKSCEEQGGSLAVTCFDEFEQSIFHTGPFGNISCCLPRAQSASDN